MQRRAKQETTTRMRAKIVDLASSPFVLMKLKHFLALFRRKT